MTIDDYIDAEPVNGMLGQYRFKDGDIYMAVTGKHAKLIDYMVEAHLNAVKEHSGKESFYGIIDIRNILRANPEFAGVIRSEMFQRTMKACAFIAETDFSRMLGEEWMKGTPVPDGIRLVGDLDSALKWIDIRKAMDSGPIYGLAS